MWAQSHAVTRGLALSHDNSQISTDVGGHVLQHLQAALPNHVKATVSLNTVHGEH